MGRPDPEPINSVGIRTLVAPVGVVVAILLGIVGFGLGSSGPTVRSPSPETATPPPHSTPSAVQDARPEWVGDLAGQLECGGPFANLGAEVDPAAEPVDPAPSSNEAQRNALRLYQTLPVKGYEPIELLGHWARHRYLIDGRTKVVMVSTDRFEGYPDDVGWEVVGLRACDESEFASADISPEGLTIWRDHTETPIVTTTIFSSRGPGHCGWESTVFLRFRGNQYFRDPRHVLKEYSVVAFDATARLPDDAVDTGFHTEAWHLFTIPSGRAVFVRTSNGRIERWPSATQEVGCA